MRKVLYLLEWFVGLFIVLTLIALDRIVARRKAKHGKTDGK